MDLQHYQNEEIGSEKRGLNMGAGKSLPEVIRDRKAFVVEFDGPNDGRNPKNWPSPTRSCFTPIPE